MSIAFFDLDKTLIAENSAKLWLKEQWDTRQISALQMVQASFMLAKYHLGFTKMEEVIAKVLALTKGEKKTDILQKTQNFYDRTIKNLYRPGAIEAIIHHREQGHEIALLTSSFDGLSELVQKDLKLDHCLCTRLEVDDDGIYTGNTIGPPCFGAKKVLYASELCDIKNIPLSQCAFYTDSASDIPLLNLVGHAIAVNPDPHLRARAQMNRWEVVDFGKPRKTN